MVIRLRYIITFLLDHDASLTMSYSLLFVIWSSKPSIILSLSLARIVEHRGLVVVCVDVIHW